MLYFLIFFNALTVSQALAEEGLIPSGDAMIHAIQQAQQLQQDSDKLTKAKSINSIFEKPNSKKGCPSQNLKEGKNAKRGCVKNTAPQLSNDNKATQILVFVSFSMPETSIKSLFQEAHLHNAVLVMRGLYQNSFVQTAQKLQELGVTIDINPELFETHNISSVPTFIFLTHSHPIHFLRGNVTLEFVSKKFKEQQSKEKVS